jgi:hypothetical protein
VRAGFEPSSFASESCNPEISRHADADISSQVKLPFQRSRVEVNQDTKKMITFSLKSIPGADAFRWFRQKTAKNWRFFNTTSFCKKMDHNIVPKAKR